YSHIRPILFFFQAEDGIRDFHVTGVQTCALPIFRVGPSVVASGHVVQVSVAPLEIEDLAALHDALEGRSIALLAASERFGGPLRSEERRVGEGWSARCAPGKPGHRGAPYSTTRDG